jgi:hypothetical protein
VNTEILRRLHADRPFRPFVIFLANGREMPVTHPEMLAVSPTNRSAVVFTGGDDFHIIDLLLATGIQVRSQPPAPGPSAEAAAGA